MGIDFGPCGIALASEPIGLILYGRFYRHFGTDPLLRVAQVLPYGYTKLIRLPIPEDQLTGRFQLSINDSIFGNQLNFEVGGTFCGADSLVIRYVQEE